LARLSRNQKLNHVQGMSLEKAYAACNSVVALVIAAEQGHLNTDDTDCTDSRGSVRSDNSNPRKSVESA